MAKAKKRHVKSLSALKADEAFVEAYVDGPDEEPLDVWYRPSAFTQEMTDSQLERFGDEAGLFEVLSDTLRELVVRWEIYAGDPETEEPLPVTVAVMRAMPLHYLSSIRTAIIDDYIPKYATRRATKLNGTDPTGTGT